MHKINELFKEMVDELWAIKRYNSIIELKDLVNLYKEYQYFSNLVVDVINSQVIQCMDSDIKLNEEDVSFIIDAFETFHKYNYNRLVIDSLCELNCKQAYQYLNKILNTDEKKIEFTREFGKRHFFDQTKEELKKLGNNI